MYKGINDCLATEDMCMIPEWCLVCMYLQHDYDDDDYDDALAYVCHLLFIPVTIASMRWRR